MTQTGKLQKLVDQIERLYEQNAKVVRIGKNYYVYADSKHIALYFQTFTKGSAWLQRWIADGQQPPLADLRIRGAQ